LCSWATLDRSSGSPVQIGLVERVYAIAMGGMDALAAELTVAVRAALADAFVVLKAQIALRSVRGDGNPRMLGLACLVSDIKTSKKLRALWWWWEGVIFIQIGGVAVGSHSGCLQELAGILKQVSELSIFEIYTESVSSDTLDLKGAYLQVQGVRIVLREG
jgi:hypothetical protein